MSDQQAVSRYQLFDGDTLHICETTLLWRYLTFERFVWLLEKSKLYHPRLDCLGDPFEGSVTRAYARKRDSGQMSPHISLAQFEPAIFRRLIFLSYATCWHASPHESDAMWKLYSSQRAGVAIVSTLPRIRDSVDLSRYKSGTLRPVEYLDFDTHDMTLPSGSSVPFGFLKLKSFEHEKEVRGIIRLEEVPKDPKKDPLDPKHIETLREEMPLGLEPAVDLKVLIKAIYISPLARQDFQDVVHISADRHGLGSLVQSSGLIRGPVY